MQYNMKKNPFAGTFKVFRFTLKQTVCSKTWLASTLIIALLMLIGIPALLFAVSSLSTKEKKDDDETQIRTVLVVDETEGKADYSVLRTEEDDPEYVACASMDAAIGESAGKDDAVILRVTDSDGTYMTTVYLPQITEISRGKASRLGSRIEEQFRLVLMQKANLTPEGAMLLSMPVRSETASVGADAQTESEDLDMVGQIIGFVIPYLMMMLIYMMVLLYGQSMANSVLLEKTTKLMETILTAVHPVALMTGKLFATAAAAVGQLLIWLFSLIGGMVGGSFFVLKMIPDTSNSTVMVIREVSDEFISLSVPGILLSIVILALGFLLYLSLSAVSGALASKAEDLNKTNVVFTMILLASMFLCIMSPSEMAAGVDAGEMQFLSDAAWLKLFPFTAILVTPGALILRKVSLLFGCGTIAILFASVILFLIIAAAIYKMLVLYRGEPLKPKQLLALFKENRARKKQSTEQSHTELYNNPKK
ncbi:MAG: ABC transporter permease [Oscillospiraceae bacterium]|nr:ABC transporter permease [Oscillospiraceae bacterium]